MELVYRRRLCVFLEGTARANDGLKLDGCWVVAELGIFRRGVMGLWFYGSRRRADADERVLWARFCDVCVCALR